MPEVSRIDLSKYRLERSGEMLVTAKCVLEAKDYATANNRAYYCIFHAMRAVLALDSEDYKKHSAVISAFSRKYLKDDIIPRSFSKRISNSFQIRARSDYEDFYICSIEDTIKLVEGAEEFLNVITEYLTNRYLLEETAEN